MPQSVGEALASASVAIQTTFRVANLENLEAGAHGDGERARKAQAVIDALQALWPEHASYSRK